MYFFWRVCFLIVGISAKLCPIHVYDLVWIPEEITYRVFICQFLFFWLCCSTLGQGLQTSTYPWEVIFSITLAIFGLILFALLIGNMQVHFKLLSLKHCEIKFAGSLVILFVQNMLQYPWACIRLGQMCWILE